MKFVLKIDVFELSIKVVGSVPQLSVTKNKISLMVSFLNPSVQTLSVGGVGKVVPETSKDNVSSFF